MSDRQRRYEGISKAAWGYFFLYFDINIGSVSLLPDFVGSLLFLGTIGLLEQDRRELRLLRPLGAILALWQGLRWLASWVGLDPEGHWQAVDLVVCLVGLYFHFQLLTDLSAVASAYQRKGCDHDRRLLYCRTLQTLMLTAVMLLTTFAPWLSEAWAVVSLLPLVVYLVAGIVLMRALFRLRRDLETENDTVDMDI